MRIITIVAALVALLAACTDGFKRRGSSRGSSLKSKTTTKLQKPLKIVSTVINTPPKILENKTPKITSVKQALKPNSKATAPKILQQSNKKSKKKTSGKQAPKLKSKATAGKTPKKIVNRKQKKTTSDKQAPKILKNVKDMITNRPKATAGKTPKKIVNRKQKKTTSDKQATSNIKPTTISTIQNKIKDKVKTTIQTIKSTSDKQATSNIKPTGISTVQNKILNVFKDTVKDKFNNLIGTVKSIGGPISKSRTTTNDEATNSLNSQCAGDLRWQYRVWEQETCGEDMSGTPRLHGACRCPERNQKISLDQFGQPRCVNFCPVIPLEEEFVAYAKCTVKDNYCYGIDLKGGCEGVGINKARKGLPNPRCIRNDGQPPTEEMTCEKMKAIETDWKAVVESLNSQSDNARRGLLGGVLRLAFHDASEYDKNENDGFGADGCLSANSNEHDGLWEDNEEIATLIEPLWQDHCTYISRADMWALVANYVLVEADSTNILRNGLSFKLGRKDSCNCDATPRKRFPKNLGMDDINRVFINQMGMLEADAVALLGAHTIGTMTPANKGFGIRGFESTPWVKNSLVFDHQYYKDIIEIPWSPAQFTPIRGRNFGQWNVFMAPAELEWDELLAPPSEEEKKKKPLRELTPNVAMLNVDMALAFELNFRNDMRVRNLDVIQRAWCGMHGTSCFRGYPNGFGCCKNVKGRREQQLRDYIESNEKFLEDFALSFNKLMDNSLRDGKNSLTLMPLDNCPIPQSYSETQWVGGA